MEDQLLARNVLLFNGCFDQLRGQIGAFTMCQHPADHAAAVDIQNDIQVIIGPFLRALELGDVPRPDFIRAGRKQFRLLVVRVSELVSAFASALIRFKDAIHRPHAAHVLPFIEQFRVDLPRRLISETFAVESIDHRFSFSERKCSSWDRSRLRLPVGIAATVQRRSRNI